MQYFNPWGIKPDPDTAVPTFFAPDQAHIPGAIGSQVYVLGEGGPQGNPLGSMQPRPYPDTDPVGHPLTFGPSMLWHNNGQANWTANVLPGVDTRGYEAGLIGHIQGLYKLPSGARISF